MCASKDLQDWLDASVSFWTKDFRLPQLLDLNSLDFSLRTHIDEKSCKTRHSNTDELKTSVNRACVSMRRGLVKKDCKSFLPQLERVIAAKGGHIE